MVQNLTSAFWLIIGSSVLARVLDPKDFGTVALVTVIYGLAGQLMDFAISPAIIQKSELTKQQTSNIFWLSIAYSFVVGLGLAASGPLLAEFFELPELFPIAAVYGLLLIIHGSSLVHSSLLGRAMRYDIGARLSVVLGPISVTVAIILALTGWGVWALVAQASFAALARAFFLCWLVRWVPTRYKVGAGVRSMLGYSLRSAFALVVNFCYEKGQSLVLGKMADPTMVGFYTRGDALFRTPMNQVMGPLSCVVLPRMSSMQDRPMEIQKFVIQIIWVIGIVVSPLMIWMLHGGEQVALMVLGLKWETSGRVMQWFALVAISTNLIFPLSRACAALGTPAKGLIVRVLMMPFYLFALGKSVSFGAEGVVLVSFIANLASLPFSLYLIFRNSPLRPHPILIELLKSTACSCLSSWLILLVNQQLNGWLLMSSYEATTLVRLAVLLVLAYVSGMSLMMLCAEARSMVRELLRRVGVSVTGSMHFRSAQ